MFDCIYNDLLNNQVTRSPVLSGAVLYLVNGHVIVVFVLYVFF